MQQTKREGEKKPFLYSIRDAISHFHHVTYAKKAIDDDRPEDALARYEKALRARPDSFDALMGAATACMFTGLAKAKSSTDPSATDFPEESRALFLRAKAYAEKACGAKRDNLPAVGLLGTICIALNEHQTVIGYNEAALARIGPGNMRDPLFVRLNVQNAVAAAGLKDPRQAEEYAGKAVRRCFEAVEKIGEKPSGDGVLACFALAGELCHLPPGSVSEKGRLYLSFVLKTAPLARDTATRAILRGEDPAPVFAIAVNGFRAALEAL